MRTSALERVACSAALLMQTIQYYQHKVLAALPKPKSSQDLYVFPRGQALFRYVQEPHYAAEVLMYVSLAAAVTVRSTNSVALLAWWGATVHTGELVRDSVAAPQLLAEESCCGCSTVITVLPLVLNLTVRRSLSAHSVRLPCL